MMDLPPYDIETQAPTSHIEHYVANFGDETTVNPQFSDLDNESSSFAHLLALADETGEATTFVETTATDSETAETVVDTPASDSETTATEVSDNTTSEEPAGPSSDALLEKAKEIRDVFADGFQWSDLTEMLKLSYEFIVTFQSLSPEDMRDNVVTMVNHVIDLTDTPYLPDKYTDPLFKAMVPPFVDLFGASILGQLLPLPTEESEKPSAERLMQFAESLKESFSDGFQWPDLAVATKGAIAFVGSFPFLSNEEKQECVIEIINDLIDITDTPNLPDMYADPIFKSMVRPFVETIFSKL